MHSPRMEAEARALVCAPVSPNARAKGGPKRGKVKMAERARGGGSVSWCGPGDVCGGSGSDLHPAVIQFAQTAMKHARRRRESMAETDERRELSGEGWRARASENESPARSPLDEMRKTKPRKAPRPTSERDEQAMRVNGVRERERAERAERESQTRARESR